MKNRRKKVTCCWFELPPNRRSHSLPLHRVSVLYWKNAQSARTNRQVDGHNNLLTADSAFIFGKLSWFFSSPPSRQDMTFTSVESAFEVRLKTHFVILTLVLLPDFIHLARTLQWLDSFFKSWKHDQPSNPQN